MKKKEGKESEEEDLLCRFPFVLMEKRSNSVFREAEEEEEGEGEGVRTCKSFGRVNFHSKEMKDSNFAACTQNWAHAFLYFHLFSNCTHLHVPILIDSRPRREGEGGEELRMNSRITA